MVKQGFNANTSGKFLKGKHSLTKNIIYLFAKDTGKVSKISHKGGMNQPWWVVLERPIACVLVYAGVCTYNANFKGFFFILKLVGCKLFPYSDIKIF